MNLDGWRLVHTKTRFGHRTGWSPCARFVGKFFLWNFRPRLAWICLRYGVPPCTQYFVERGGALVRLQHFSWHGQFFLRDTKWTSNFSLWPTSNRSGNLKSDEAAPRVKYFLQGSMHWLMSSVLFCRFVDTKAMRSSLRNLHMKTWCAPPIALIPGRPKLGWKVETHFLQWCNLAPDIFFFFQWISGSEFGKLEIKQLDSRTVLAGHPPWPKNYLLPSFSRKLCGEAKPLRIAVSESEWILKWLDLRLCNAFKLVPNHGNNLWLGNGHYQPAMPFSQGCHFGTESWSHLRTSNWKVPSELRKLSKGKIQWIS